jgi:predicted flap endonuclease-1-like 5' DNA nuclease
MPTALTVLTKEYIMTKVTDTFQSSQSDIGAPWWFFWLLVVLGLVAVIIGWRLRREPGEDITEATSSPEDISTPQAASTAETPEVEPIAAVAGKADAEPVKAATATEQAGPDESPVTKDAAVTTEPPAEEQVENATDSAAVANQAPVETEAIQEETSTKEAPVAETSPDNLTKIEGIGPKISGLLQNAGFKTFAQLATAEVEQLRQILADAGLKFAHPDTWPEQAALAAAGKWEELSVLQDNLHGGRKKG